MNPNDIVVGWEGRTPTQYAEALALELRRYWADRGYLVKTRVVTDDGTDRLASVVRSNMVNGLPVAHATIAPGFDRKRRNPIAEVS